MNIEALTELSTPSIPVTQCGYIEETVSLDTMADEWAARNRRWRALSPKTSTLRLQRKKHQREREERVIFLRTFLFMSLIVLAVAIVPILMRVNL